jgi:hypothetical protein
LESTPGEIDSLIAAFADMFLIELIGENFHCFAALRTATFERRQRLKSFPSGASFRRVHFLSPLMVGSGFNVLLLLFTLRLKVTLDFGPAGGAQNLDLICRAGIFLFEFLGRYE